MFHVTSRLALVLAVLLAIQIARAADDTYEGKVLSVGENTLMIMGKAMAENRAFAVNAETKITRNGKSAKLSEVQIGDQAHVTATGSGTNTVAKEIVVTAAK